MLNGVVFDLDGTLSDHSARVHLARAKEWDAFHEALEGDAVFPDAAKFLRDICGTVHTVICTGRNERYRERTRNWLLRNGLASDVLLMRPDGDYTPDHVLKPRLLTESYASWENVLAFFDFALDDRDKVVEAYRERGLACWQVRNGSY